MGTRPALTTIIASHKKSTHASRTIRPIGFLSVFALVICLCFGLAACSRPGDSTSPNDSQNAPISDRDAPSDNGPREIWIVESMTGTTTSDELEFTWNLDSVGSYDDEGRLVERTALTFEGEEYPAAQYAYDELGRLVSYTGAGEDEMGGIFTETWNAEYSDDGLTAVFTCGDTPFDMRAEFTYDENGRLVRFRGNDMHVGQNVAAPMADYGYDGLGRLVYLTGTNGWNDSNVDIHYSETGTLAQIGITGSAGDWTYLFDEEGRLVQRIGDGRTIDFEYDGSGALVSASGDGVDATFTSDANGNIKTAEIDYVQEPGGAATHTVYELTWRKVEPDENGAYPRAAASMLDPIHMAKLGWSVSDDLFSPVSGGDPASMMELDSLIQQGLARAHGASPEELEAAVKDGMSAGGIGDMPTPEGSGKDQGYHVDTTYYGFDIPEYWRGKVTWVKDDEGNVSVFANGLEYRASILELSVCSGPEAEVMGDIGNSWIAGTEGEDWHVEAWRTRYAFLAANGYLDDEYTYEEICTLVDLSTMGEMSYDELMELGDALDDEYFAGDEALSQELSSTLVQYEVEAVG